MILIISSNTHDQVKSYVWRLVRLTGGIQFRYGWPPVLQDQLINNKGDMNKPHPRLREQCAAHYCSTSIDYMATATHYLQFVSY